MPISHHWLDRVTAPVAPRWTLRRQRARAAAALLERHYEGAEASRRTQGWRRSAGDGNAVNQGALTVLRELARELVRNNPYAESALGTIVDDAVGWGIVAKSTPANKQADQLWRAWAETTDCDADGRHDFYGLQKLVMRTVVESGEVLIRRRRRRPEDGYALPLQLQVLEPDFLDVFKTLPLQNGGEIVQGVEFDPLGTRVAYWLFSRHPGSALMTGGAAMFPASKRVQASDVLHVFKGTRAGQVRAVSWFANALLRFKDFDEFEDATLMKQKIAACLAIVTHDVDGTGAPLGVADDTTTPGTDALEPGAIVNLPSGRDVSVVQPPSVREYNDYCEVTLRAIATGIGVTYEDLTGDYTNLPFSAARMSRLRHQRRIDDWRWRLLIPQFCNPAWGWAMEAAQILGVQRSAAKWTPPPAPMIEPDKEGLAYQRNIRTGIQSWSDAVRERGLDPVEQLEELAADNAAFDKLKIVLDSDARKMTQAGQSQAALSGGGGGEA